MTSSTDTVRLQRTIAASPARVYRAWLDPALVRRWMAPGDLEVTRVEIDERVGGRYRIWQGSADGDAGGFEAELLELDADRRIVWRWGFVGPQRESGPRMHPCRRVQEALRAAGIAYDKVVSGHGSPFPFLRKGSRDELQAATGSKKLPALKQSDGTVITNSRGILAYRSTTYDARGVGQPAAADDRRPPPGQHDPARRIELDETPAGGEAVAHLDLVDAALHRLELRA